MVLLIFRNPSIPLIDKELFANNSCWNFSISKRDFCLPKNRVQLESGGPHAQSLRFYTKKSDGLGYVRITITDEVALRGVPVSKTYPEWVIGNLINGKSDDVSQALMNLKHFTSGEDVNFHDLDEVFRPVRKSQYEPSSYFSVVDNRIFEYVEFFKRTGVYKQSIRYFSNIKNSNFTIKIQFLSNFDSVNESFSVVRSINEEFLSILK